LAVQRLGGWSEAEASGALAEASGDVGLAHAALAAAEEAAILAAQAAGLAELTAKGYDADGANTRVYNLVICVCIGARRRVSLPVAKRQHVPRPLLPPLVVLWDGSAVAAGALRESMNNVTAAAIALAADAAALSEQLEEAVTHMVAKGWPEDEVGGRTWLPQ
jgi:hypothetical protein